MAWSGLAGAGLVAAIVVWRRAAAQPDWYRTAYRLAYRSGFTPWDRGAPAPQLVRFLESAAAPATGRALDLGCGAGTNS
ncbi:MAG: TPMT family class I SAM-dependent methyltransferase, partial [Candidatus Dormibacteraeota bacterium]|nr:TPMT family class I SAM-dependent methyltransferase [Candidatus Dormibacteraeota bacterium]